MWTAEVTRLVSAGGEHRGGGEKNTFSSPRSVGGVGDRRWGCYERSWRGREEVEWAVPEPGGRRGQGLADAWTVAMPRE